MTISEWAFLTESGRLTFPFGVGISYGIRKINVPFTSNLLIALVTSTGTLLSVLLGRSIYLFISAEMTGLLGGGIIIAAGIWVLFQEKIMHRGQEPQEEKRLVAETGLPRFGFRQIVSILDNPVIADWDFSGHIDLKEAIALSLGLTINNIPNGVGRGDVGLQPHFNDGFRLLIQHHDDLDWHIRRSFRI